MGPEDRTAEIERVKKDFFIMWKRFRKRRRIISFAGDGAGGIQTGKGNLASTDTLYRIGQQRHRIAAISQADLLTLKLDKVNAQNTLQNRASALKRANVLTGIFSESG